MYIQGSKYIAAHALSDLEVEEHENIIQTDKQSMAEHFTLDKNDLPDYLHPVDYKTIMKFQQKDNTLTETANMKANS